MSGGLAVTIVSSSGDTVTASAPMPVSDALASGTRAYNFEAATRTVTAAASSGVVAFGDLGDSREVMLTCTERCYVVIGDASVSAASAASAEALPISADEKFHLKLREDQTHYCVIRDSADGVFRAIPVI